MGYTGFTVFQLACSLRVVRRDEPAFDVDPAALERQYKALQVRLHPDKYALASPLELEYAQQQAAVVNQAYDVLKKPLRRAHYIVSAVGGWTG